MSDTLIPSEVPRISYNATSGNWEVAVPDSAGGVYYDSAGELLSLNSDATAVDINNDTGSIDFYGIINANGNCVVDPSYFYRSADSGQLITVVSHTNSVINQTVAQSAAMANLTTLDLDDGYITEINADFHGKGAAEYYIRSCYACFVRSTTSAQKGSTADTTTLLNELTGASSEITLSTNTVQFRVQGDTTEGTKWSVRFWVTRSPIPA